MKLTGLSLLAAFAATSLGAAPVLADRVVVQRTTVTHTDNGWHNGYHHRRHRVCRTHWYHHRRVTRCFWR